MDSPKQELLRLYRLMQRIRKFEAQVQRSFADGDIPGFVHLYIGQEATAVGVCSTLRDDDTITSTHRGHGHLIAKGGKLDRMMAELYAKETGYCRGRGGSMHIVDVSLGILGANGIVAAGTQIATGAALTCRYRKSGQVAVSFLGDSATAEGMFHESINLAAAWNLPVVFVCENNLYGQFTPYAAVSRLPDTAERAKGYGVSGVVVDGNDVLAVREAATAAVERARTGGGPTLIEAKTYRWKGHYEGDVYDYRPKSEVEEWKARCPIARFEKKLVDDGVASREDLEAIAAEVDAEVKAAVAFAEESPDPDPDSVLDSVSSPEAITEITGGAGATKELSFAQAIHAALASEMRRDPSVIVLGEDVATGIFGVTGELDREFGRERVLDTPISENVIAGASVGAALTGLRPVAEIEFDDFLTCCMDPIVNQAAKLRFMTGGQVTVPLVIRTCMGGGFSAAAQHSQCLDAWMAKIPGLVIAVPATPADAKGLLATAIRSDNPVVFFEAKSMYYNSGPVPEGEYLIPFGKADVKKEGKDVTVVAVAAMVANALGVAERLEEDGISVEVVDPRTLVPLDRETIVESVKKTGRLVVVEEGTISGGFGAEVAAVVARDAFDHLDAPIERVAAPDTPIPFAPVLEEAVIPDEDRIEEAVRSVMGG